MNECFNAGFKYGDIDFSQPLKERPWANKKKYYQFHKSHGHTTKECVQLKDIIETLTQTKTGKAYQYDQRIQLGLSHKDKVTDQCNLAHFSNFVL